MKTDPEIRKMITEMYNKIDRTNNVQHILQSIMVVRALKWVLDEWDREFLNEDET